MDPCNTDHVYPCDPDSQGNLLCSEQAFGGVLVTCEPQSGAGQHITSLRLSGSIFHGSLTNLDKFNFSMMHTLEVKDTRLSGSLPPVLHGPSLQTVVFDQNSNLNGPVPTEWAGKFPSLKKLQLSNSSWTGQLPDIWGLSDSFPQLGELAISGPSEVQETEARGLVGPIPAGWGQPGSFPSLEVLEHFLT